MERLRSRVLEVGIARLTLPGEAESGDLYLIKRFRNGVLVAVVDGLGHGSDAAKAAGIAVDTMTSKPRDSVIALLERCHENLIDTRGVVMSLASFNTRDNTMAWAGVGNVESILLRADASLNPPYESLVLRSGLLGSRLPRLQAAIISVARGDTLILTTDGVRSDFAAVMPMGATPQQIADHILTHHQKGTDDALVLVARYSGPGDGRWVRRLTEADIEAEKPC